MSKNYIKIITPLCPTSKPPTHCIHFIIQHYNYQSNNNNTMNLPVTEVNDFYLDLVPNPSSTRLYGLKSPNIKL
jgi:hypothetical protein